MNIQVVWSQLQEVLRSGFAVVHVAAVLLIFILEVFFAFSIRVFAKWWSTNEVVLCL